ncbi:MAG: tyrosine-type recombinase/integrase [Deltaproteobacteria bacterium]|nr:tyrosine-type recombinase/integrase [Deltaproteobacteria bacterium]
MSSTRYLQKIGYSWYVRVKVPKSLQEIVGNTHIRRAIHTRDLNEANRLKWAMVTGIKAELSRLEGLDPLNLKAHQYRQEVRKAFENENYDLVDALEDIAVEEAEKIETNTGNLKKAQEWYNLATTKSQTLDELIDTWLISSEYTEQTKKQHRKAYEELKTFIGGENLPTSVTDDTAISFVEDYMKKSGFAYETQRRKINSLVAFWKWLGMRKHVPRSFNPWRGFTLSKKRTPKKTENKRNHTEEELIRLFSGNPKYAGLEDVMVLGLYTGARLNEICSLRNEDVSKNGDGIYFISIEESKTKAGIRKIAVAHPLPCSVLNGRLQKGGKPEKQLFPEFKPGGYDEKLSWHVSKAFSRYRNKMGLSKATDFHSFRRTSITLMENLGMDQVKIARYVGHELQTIAFIAYSGGSNEKTNVEVAKGLKYSEEVEEAVRVFLDRTKTEDQ